MDKLNAELQRLHLVPEEGSAAGRRVLSIAFLRAADWEAAASLWNGVQADLDLPAPLISVDGRGFHLWFCFMEPVTADQGQQFLESLRQRYLADLPATRLQFRGDEDAPPPCELPEGERWTAFIDPELGSMFSSEPWLEMPPNPNQQGELLAAFQCIRPTEFGHALSLLQPSPLPSEQVETLSLNTSFNTPREFLLAVMNDPQASIALRIDAAKALLPYFEKA